MSAPKPPKGHFNILYFASASSHTGKDMEALPAPLPLRKFFDTLEERYQGIRQTVLDHSLVTINLSYVEMPSSEVEDGEDNAVVIQEGDEVAIIPPVSSG